MGNYSINIQGIGPHHNSGATDTVRDAEKLAAFLVQRLKESGHRIESATFTYGSTDELGGDNVAEINRLNRIIADKRSPAGT